MTNADNAKNFKLMQVFDNAKDKASWSNLITMQPTEKIEDVDLFQVWQVFLKATAKTFLESCCDLWSSRWFAHDFMLRPTDKSDT